LFLGVFVFFNTFRDTGMEFLDIFIFFSVNDALSEIGQLAERLTDSISERFTPG